MHEKQAIERGLYRMNKPSLPVYIADIKSK
jgi:hypothetical protein